MQKYSFIILLIVTLLLLASCTSQPSEKQLKLTSTLSPPPATATPVPSPTIEPTATPFVPLTVEEIEEKLEKLTEKDFEYIGEEEIDDYVVYIFKRENEKYTINSLTGNVISYSFTRETSFIIDIVEEEGALEVAIGEIKKHCPEFFDYKYELKSSKPHESMYVFHFSQLSHKGVQTGNHISISIARDGSIDSYFIICNNDPETIDEDITISRKEALKIAYETAKDEIKYYDDDNIIELEFDNSEIYETEIHISYFNNKTIWNIEFEQPDELVTKQDVHYPKVWVQIDANTGEVIFIDKCR